MIRPFCFRDSSQLPVNLLQIPVSEDRDRSIMGGSHPITQNAHSKRSGNKKCSNRYVGGMNKVN